MTKNPIYIKDNPRVCIINLPSGSRRLCHWRENGNQKQQYYYRWLWEKTFGKIPKGFSIHHKDRNTLNDSIGNLEMLKNQDHAKLHWNEDRDFIHYCHFLKVHNSLDHGKKHKYMLFWQEVKGINSKDKLDNILIKYNIENYQTLSTITGIDIGQLSRIRNKQYGIGRKNIQRIFNFLTKKNLLDN